MLLACLDFSFIIGYDSVTIVLVLQMTPLSPVIVKVRMFILKESLKMHIYIASINYILRIHCSVAYIKVMY